MIPSPHPGDCEDGPMSDTLTTIDSRYEVGCECCGLLCAFARKIDACQAAADYTEDQHRMVTVYDRMAHRGHGRIIV